MGNKESGVGYVPDEAVRAARGEVASEASEASEIDLGAVDGLPVSRQEVSAAEAEAAAALDRLKAGQILEEIRAKALKEKDGTENSAT